MVDLKFRIKIKQYGESEWLHSDSFKTLLLFFKAIENYEYDRAELQRYTGLKDKNGHKIYEKDWLKHFKYMFEVCFYKGAFYGKQKGVEYYVLLNEMNEHSEIIGNNYENPELN